MNPIIGFALLLAALVAGLVLWFVREPGPGGQGSPAFWWLLLLMIGGFSFLFWRRERLAPRLELAGGDLLVWRRPGVLAPPAVAQRIARATVVAVEILTIRPDPLRRLYQVRLCLADGGTIDIGSTSPRQYMARRPAENLAVLLQVPLRADR